MTPGNEAGVYRQTDVDIIRVFHGDEPFPYYGLTSVSAGEWLNYTVNVATTGIYTITVEVQSIGPGGTFHLEVNGVDKTGPVSVPDTSGFRSGYLPQQPLSPLACRSGVW